MLSYSWVCNDTGGLDLDNLLDELDSTDAYTGRSRVHPLQDIGFDRGHGLPGIRFGRDSLLRKEIIRPRYTVDTSQIWLGKSKHVRHLLPADTNSHSYAKRVSAGFRHVHCSEK